MSDRQQLAEHVTGIGVAGLASMGLEAAPLIPLAVLAAWGVDRYKACKERKQRNTVDRVIKQIEKANPDHRAVGPALALLKDNRHKVAVSPQVLADAEKRGNFPETLYHIVFDGVGVPKDDGVEALLKLVMEAAWQELRLEDDYHKVFVQEAVTALERDIADGFERIEQKLTRVQETVSRTEDKVDQTQAMVQALFEREKDTAKQLGIREAQLIALAQRIAENVADPDTAFREVQLAVEEAAALRARSSQPSNLGDFVDQVMARVLARSDEGDLAGAEAEALLGLEDWRAQQEHMQAQGLKMMDLVIAQARQSRNVELVVQTEMDRVALEHPERTDKFLPLKNRVMTYNKRGTEQGVAFDLEVALCMTKAMIKGLSLEAVHKADCLSILGDVLRNLGVREGGTARLQEAVTTLRAALEQRTREQAPHAWAALQNNLGTALKALGERESGTASWKEAMLAYRAALEVYTPEREPIYWASVRSNLGVTLTNLAERGSETELLEAAIKEFQAVMEIWTRKRMPKGWANTQRNLGAALAVLGQRETGTVRLEEAIVAYRAALEENTQDRMPMSWAMTTQELGLVNEALFDKTGDRAKLEEAIRLVRATREVFDEAGASFFIEKSDRILARLEAKL